MTGAAMRCWCAVIQYPSKLPIMYGTAVVRREAPSHEVEALLRERITACLPDGWNLINMMPGSIFFQAEAEGDSQ